ncbi:carboxypeptidase regulatory-like domain-containing protein [candidate division KSB1 bacterium]|nr:carboxypeptidase regulatory-like domain-containing protein [candidate division KSB1 bacterium]
MRKNTLQTGLLIFLFFNIFCGIIWGKEAANDSRKRIAFRSALHIATALNTDATNQFSAMGDSSWYPEDFGQITGHINGIVTDGPVRGNIFALLESDNNKQEILGAGIIHDDHNYEIMDLPPGNYLVVAYVEGYLPQFYGNTVTSDSAAIVTVASGEQVSGIDIDLVSYPIARASISGIVTKDGSNAPIHGAGISAFSTTNPFLFARAASDSAGNYTLSGLLPGKYIIQADARGFMPEYYDDAPLFEKAATVTISDSEHVTGINFSLQQSSQIVGTVTLDDGHPLPNVMIYASSIDSTASHLPDVVQWPLGIVAVSDFDGNYALDDLQSGSYYVKAIYTDGFFYQEQWWAYDSTNGLPGVIELREGEQVSGIDFVFSQVHMEGLIEGYVYDLSGKPLQRAQVMLEPANGSTDGKGGPDGDFWPGYWHSVVTDENGYFNMRDLPDGDYYVSAQYIQGGYYYQMWWNNAESRDDADLLTLGKTVDSLSITFNLPVKSFNAIISGHVFDKANQPLQSAWVNVRPVEILRCYESPEGMDDRCGYQTSGWAQTDSNGYYEVKNLAEGEYFAHAQYWSGISYGEIWYENSATVEGATPIQLPEDGIVTDADFHIDVHPIYGTIAGTVRDAATGQPITRAHVELMPVGSDRIAAPIYFWNYAVAVDENGRFDFSWLPEGDYLVSAYSNGAFTYYPDASVAEFADTLHVSGGKNLEIEFNMVPRKNGNGSISGWIGSQASALQMEVGVIIARPTITVLVWPESEMFYSAVSNPDGTYELNGLPEGEYYLYGFASNFIPEYYNDVYDPSKATFVRVESGNPATGIDFELMPAFIFNRDEAGNPALGGTAQISGLVTNNDNVPLANANVYLLDNAGNVVAAARTNSNGEYLFAGVQNGQYHLQATHFGNTSQYNDNSASLENAPVVLVNGDLADVNFILTEGTSTSVGEKEEVKLPTGLQLLGNYPNPFNPQTKIKFVLGEDSHVTLNIYNLLGRKVATLLDSDIDAGEYSVTWDARDKNGAQLGTGLYFYQITTKYGMKTGKMILQK